MDKKLQKSKAWRQFQAQIVKQIHAAIISIDRAGYITSWSRGAERLCGYSADEALGKHIALLYPQEGHLFSGYPLFRLLYKKGYHELELQLRRKSGESFYAHLTLSLLREGNGTVTGIIGHLVDMTACKKAEEALKEAAWHQDKFLTPLAYELRNLLVPIRNAVHLLKLQAKPEHLYLQQSCVLIERQLDRLMRLVDKLLDMARISCGQVTLQKKQVDLIGCAVQAVETVRPFLDERGHDLTLGFAPAPLLVEADPKRLTQIIEHLLHNAAKYTGERGQIRLTIGQEGTEAVLKVQDNGIGIPAEWLPGLFDRLTSPERPLNRPQAGLGLGLSLAKSLVEMHGGRIHANSPGPNQGSTFMIFLPLASTRPSPTPAPVGKNLPATPCRRVLIVDDNRNIAHSFEILLNLWGHQVQAAPDGLTALELARTFQPEVILLDISLPDIDGYEVARRLRAEYGPRLKLVALTGHGEAQDKQRAKEAGFDQYLIKPLPTQTLKDVLALVASSPPPHSSPGSL